jgi:hypothetical protein
MRLAQFYCLSRVPSRQELGTYTRALIRTFGSVSRAENRDFGLSDAVRWEDGPVKVLKAIARGRRGTDRKIDRALLFIHAVRKIVCSGPACVLEATVRPEVQAAGNLEDPKSVDDLMRTIENNTHRARFFITKSLRMGLAPIDAAISDQIAILASGNAPILLRPVSVDYTGEEAYRVMGGCYVDGKVT